MFDEQNHLPVLIEPLLTNKIFRLQNIAHTTILIIRTDVKGL